MASQLGVEGDGCGLEGFLTKAFLVCVSLVCVFFQLLVAFSRWVFDLRFSSFVDAK